MVRKFAAIFCVLILAGCSSVYRNHGYVPNDEDLSQIVVGVDTRDTVADVVGSPSAGGVLDSSGYYYISSRVRHFAYRRPEVVNREVLAISFDEAGVVSNIERFGLEDGQVVPITRRVTETGDTSNAFLQQLLRSLGNFAADDLLE
ncbi:outer membrane protein assembly factor BamE [Lutimaribacter sp. EGI FJ00015]|uniref:Outer membrane protein assembly factor BamE n=1 Tax=Lutimaribacter degradans TaxID=2945989 RepID=A0ACC5ZVS4_9RHOB|nr:outer membrane protein assembly factor BamE [Lutimaribacter sp. EGI FJ00013]MCM2562429.1 outer membrane protein assembly factor BamE [Lutimaribacter sp. EGI FJ00013]MCO0613586.1 outer membrane protein assembly factor BamE [Lutimaribacter sp. EGI FJ00015]MCO0636558.1 outer membrane protein assembly factor BamE [Lutimaribacter sp. EGI FJ00014]